MASTSYDFDTVDFGSAIRKVWTPKKPKIDIVFTEDEIAVRTLYFSNVYKKVSDRQIILNNHKHN